jgi:hypothetical protein
MAKIIDSSANITKAQIFNLEHESTEKMAEAEGEPLEIVSWILQEREGDDGNPYRVLIVESADGLYYSTGSDTFINVFTDALEAFGEVKKINVATRKSRKSGRDYLTLSIVE